MAGVAQKALLSFAAVRVFPRAFTTNGQRTSWKLAIGVWLAMPPVRPRPTRSKTCAVKPAIATSQKKHGKGWARPRMRYAASEKLEIIRLVERSQLSARQTLAKLGVLRTTFYHWYDRYQQRGEAGLQDRSPTPKHVWNGIPDDLRRKVVKLALKETELSPRELAVTFPHR